MKMSSTYTTYETSSKSEQNRYRGSLKFEPPLAHHHHLPSNIPLIIDEAKKGQLHAFFLLAIGEESVTFGYGEDVARLFFDYLDEHRPPRKDHTGTNPPAIDQIPLLCLLGIGNVGRRNVFIMANDAFNYWTQVYEWMKFYFETEIIGTGNVNNRTDEENKATPNTPLIKGKQNVLNILTQVFYAYANWCIDFRWAVTQDHGIYRLIASLWFQDGSRAPSDSFAIDALVLCKFKSENIMADCETHVEAASTKVDQIVAAAKGDTRFVANFVLTRVQELFNCKELLFRRTLLYMQLLTTLVIPCGVMKKTLLELGCIPVVCKMMRRLTFRPVPHGNEGDATELVADAGFDFLSEALDVKPTFPWVKQLLERNVFKLIVFYLKPMLEFQRGREALVNLLENILPQHLLFLKFISPITESIEKGFTAEKFVKYVEHDEMNADDIIWKTFETMVLERVIISCMFILAPPSREHCDNLKCQNAKSGLKLRTCSRCLFRTYCSTSCHVEAWNSGGHKEECPLLTAKYGKRVLPSHKGMHAEFLDRVALREIRRHIPGLRKMAKKEYGNYDFRRFCVCVDFTTNPATFSLHRPTFLLKENVFLASIVREHLKRSDSLLYKVKYPGGEYIELKTGKSAAAFLQAPRLKGNQTIDSESKRAPGRDLEGGVVQIAYDEIDDIIERLNWENELDVRKGKDRKYLWSVPFVLSELEKFSKYRKSLPFEEPILLF